MWAAGLASEKSLVLVLMGDSGLSRSPSSFHGQVAGWSGRITWLLWRYERWPPARVNDCPRAVLQPATAVRSSRIYARRAMLPEGRRRGFSLFRINRRAHHERTLTGPPARSVPVQHGSRALDFRFTRSHAIPLTLHRYNDTAVPPRVHTNM